MNVPIEQIVTAWSNISSLQVNKRMSFNITTKNRNIGTDGTNQARIIPESPFLVMSHEVI